MSTSPDLSLGLIVLNWNGSADSIACLNSIFAESRRPARVLLVDNGSTDGSVEDVQAWLREQPEAVRSSFKLVENDRNLGFAAGNNVGIRLLLDTDVPPRYVMLLNNDTVLAPGALAELVDGMDQRAEVQCMVPQIRYAGAPNRIWNCGGEWTWFGTPRYAYADRPASELDGKPPFAVTFVTGCALVLRTSWLKANGALSERFFFGEEDVDLSWRMRKSSSGSMLCWPRAVIYHKVGVSLVRMARASDLPRMYVHYLNRMIFLRTLWGAGFRWRMRNLVMFAYMTWRLTTKFQLPLAVARGIVADLARDAREKDGVGADYFFWVMRVKFETMRPTADFSS